MTRVSKVETRTVTEAEAGMRLDRWFRLHYPALGHGRLEKLLRQGQVRLDGARVKAGARITAGARVRVPPLADSPDRPAPAACAPAPVTAAQAAELEASILHIDRHIIALNKPAGLAVQGGSKTTRHLDGMLDGLRFDSPERPRLVHRLDKDTSGVLLLARDRATAARLGKLLAGHETRKLYWALVMGAPRPRWGRIDARLDKQGRPGGERMVMSEDGKRAITEYATVATAGQRAAWLVLRPLTGRTHQLRAHCQMIGHPIVGDGKYGGRDAFLAGVGRRLHLHARTIALPRPGGGWLEITAPLGPHMRTTWKMFDFDQEEPGDPFAEAGG